MAESRFDGRQLGFSLALLTLACGSGSSLEGGFISVPWKTANAPSPPPFADSATTTALATGAPGVGPEAAGSPRRKTPARPAVRGALSSTDRKAAPATARAGAGTESPPAAAGASGLPVLTSGRLESTLIRLRDLERRHHRLTGSYSAHPSRLGLSADAGMDLRVVWASPWGWAAVARDAGNLMPACAIYVGTVPSTLSNDGRVGSARSGAPQCMDSGEQPSRMLNQVLKLANDPPSADEGLLSLMRSDLMNLATSQRQYRAVQGTYSRTTKVLNIHYSWSSGVALSILSANSKGWSGQATYDQLPGKSCVIYGGKVAVSDLPTTEEQRLVPRGEGAVVCDR